MEKSVYFKLKDLEISIMRHLFNETKNEMKPPTLTQARILEYILEHKKENIYQKDLEKTLNIRRATVSEVLKTMEKKRLIVREQNPKDARSKRIILLELESEKQEQIKTNIKNMEKILLKNISSDELKAFSLTLEKMQKNISKKYNKEGEDK